MNWKTDFRLNDLDASTEFEITCKRCRTTRTMTQAQLVRSEPELIRLYLRQAGGRAQGPQGGLTLDTARAAR